MSPRPRRGESHTGHPVDLLIVFAVAAGLAFVTVWIAGGQLISTVDPQDDPTYSQVTARLFPWITVIGITLAGSGAVLRALAHGHDHRRNQDYLGKLIAVGAFLFAGISGVGAVVPAFHDLPVFASVIGVMLLICAVIGACTWIVRSALNARRGRPSDQT